MSRDPNAKVPLTLRLPERLRQKIEDRAKHYNRSLNSQIIADLENLDVQHDLVIAKFGTQSIADLCQVLAGAGVLAQIQTKKRIEEDPETMSRMVLAMHLSLQMMMPEAPGHRAGEFPSAPTVEASREIAEFLINSFFRLKEPLVYPNWLEPGTRAIDPIPPA